MSSVLAWFQAGKNGKAAKGPGRVDPDDLTTFERYGYKINRNAGAGDCGGYSLAGAICAHAARGVGAGCDDKFKTYNHRQVRADIAAELRACPGLYAHGIKDCMKRVGNFFGHAPFTEINDAKYAEYVDKTAALGRDFDSVEWQAASMVYPWLSGLVFLRPAMPPPRAPRREWARRVAALPREASRAGCTHFGQSTPQNVGGVYAPREPIHPQRRGGVRQKNFALPRARVYLIEKKTVRMVRGTAARCSSSPRVTKWSLGCS